jgi:hypothetical protein
MSRRGEERREARATARAEKGQPLGPIEREDCPCVKAGCPRHGRCGPCRERHAPKPPRCERA